MGICGSKEIEEELKTKANSAVVAAPEKEVESKAQVKLLLLGPGESGKSTIFKQMKLIHLQGYSTQEFQEYKPVIYGNTILSMQILLKHGTSFGIPLENDENLGRAEKLLNINPSGLEWNTEVGENIKALWSDAGIRKVYNRNNEFQLNDSAGYYFDNIDRINSPTYVPTEQDLLRTRVQTTGITEVVFDFGGLNFRMVDVGGQRNERKKWIHCFQGVTSVIFCVSLSEINQVLREDMKTNRTKESLMLFDEICNSKWFEDVPLILLLNKADLFKEKLEKGMSIKPVFPDYTGADTFEDSIDYLRKEFLSLNRRPDIKKVYDHVTCATDTDNVKLMFTDVKDMIISMNLDAML